MEFTNRWFEGVIPVWEAILSQTNPRSYLEIGVYEGQSLLYVASWMERNGGGCCVGIDPYLEDETERIAPGTHRTTPPASEVRARALRNMDKFLNAADHVSVSIREDTSKAVLPDLLSAGDQFDLIYVDGSHHASDVLFDLVLAWELLAPGGVLICDDYLWRAVPFGHQSYNLLNHPKMAIDAFVNINYDKLWVIEAVNRQVYISKPKETKDES